jgi:tRNA threonylcarbamoyl adenosine modification protein YeaZ
MRILAIETATASSSVALGDDRSLVAMSVQVDRRGHVGFLVPALDFCFTRAGWAPTDLDVVVVDIGPGPFAGIRAGLAAAQGIAAATGAQLVAANSLDVLALRAATGRRRIWPVVDARRGEIAVAPYQPVPGGVVRDGPIELVTPDAFRGLMESDTTEALIVGDYQAIPRGILTNLRRTKFGRPRYPSADVLVEIGAQRAAKLDFTRPEDLRPMYLREPDARINWTDFREEGIWPGPDSP